MANTTEILNPLFNVGNNTVVEYGGTYLGVTYQGRTNFSTTNPEFTSSIFLSYYPEFTKLVSGDDAEYEDLFNAYAKMANSTLNAKRFGEVTWDFLMSSFIAHYMALTFMRLGFINTSSELTTQQIITMIGNQPIGVRTRESLGGEEVQTENMINVGLYKDAGEFLTTPYGRAFWNTYISYAKNFIRGVY